MSTIQWGVLLGTMSLGIVYATASDAPAPASLSPAAVVQVGGCSGVCVDVTGLVLTARHCDLEEVERIRFANYEVIAVRIFESGETEGPVVYDCVGEGYPASAVALEKPQPGEAVQTLGYPDQHGIRSLSQVGGTVQQGGRYQFRGGEFLGNLTNLPLHEGWSGGPLFNARGEVVGLATSTDGTDSIFISHAATRAAFESARQLHSRKLPLRIGIDLGNDECLTFLADFAQDPHLRRELQEHFEISVSDATSAADATMAASVPKLPVFRVSSEVVATGYAGKLELLQRLVPHVTAPESTGTASEQP